MIDAQIDQNQCRRLKGYYGFEHPKSGIEPGAGVLPQSSLRYATAVRRCENCRSRKACQDWLDHAPAMVNFAPDFYMNTDILFDLQYDQAGPRRAN
jgi:hypothetical protein